ncbi:MAG: glycoside hydrolase family 88 protein [Sphingobacteriaceae bacterium]|nr:glycoside hydrolase family 88 protein [Sphingobacteriaceae bacterium]
MMLNYLRLYGLIGGLLLTANLVTVQQKFEFKRTPIESIKLIADYLIDNTKFAYQLTPQSSSQSFTDIKFINFSRTFGDGKPAVAYALTELVSPVDTTITLQISHSSGVKIWLNNKLTYLSKNGMDTLVRYFEHTKVLPETFSVKLSKGANRLLIKAESQAAGWQIYFGPKTLVKNLKLTLEHIPQVDSNIVKLSNWLVIGPFPNPIENNKYTGLEKQYEPETEFKATKVYNYNTEQVFWTIPKLELRAQHIGKQQAWGEFYSTWNYHCAGTAWAMAHLGDYTGINRFRDYAKSYCDFYAEEKPIITLLKNQLGEMSREDTKMYSLRMLDYTAAPSLVYAYFLLQQGSNANLIYKDIYNYMRNYVVKEQLRSPEGYFIRTSPHKYTIWADDMFMGIPFLLYSAKLESNNEAKLALYTDAAKQLIGFHKYLSDPVTGLYHQAQYLDKPVNIPYWSRANGWAIWAHTEALLHLPKTHPLYPTLLSQFKSHINALIKYQNPQTGFFHNVLDKPDSYPETSGTAIFTMALARGINNGWLERKIYTPFVLKGWKAIDSVTDADGTIHGICIGTNLSENVRNYYIRPTNDNDTHGVFAAIFAAIEVDKLIS